MSTVPSSEELLAVGQQPLAGERPAWSRNLLCLWEHRILLRKVFIGAALVSVTVSLILPLRYKSSTTIMPPEQTNTSAAMLAALTGRGGAIAGLGNIAGGLLGVRSSGELFIDLLRSGSVAGAVAQDFHLQQVYHKKYMEDTLKKLASSTEIVENKKSGVISLTVIDTDPKRARDLAQDYVTRLNNLLIRVSTSSAHRERVFIEQRLQGATQDLANAETQLSNFSSSTSTIDIKEQTRATVDAGARLQAQLIVSQSELGSLSQIYGDENVRVKAARERIALLQRELTKMGGSAQPSTEPTGELYPPLRQLPALGVRYADLYRQVRVQEAVYELLSAQYETARIQEAKEVPTVAVIDAAGIPERKAYPHRTIITLAGTFIAFFGTALFLLLKRSWLALPEASDLKSFVRTLRSKPGPNAAALEPEVTHT